MQIEYAAMGGNIPERSRAVLKKRAKAKAAKRKQQTKPAVAAKPGKTNDLDRHVRRTAKVALLKGGL
jgi:hypothetical protein